jgi:hypothetical protein
MDSFFYSRQTRKAIDANTVNSIKKLSKGLHKEQESIPKSTVSLMSFSHLLSP